MPFRWALVVVTMAAALAAQAPAGLDRDAERWVDATLKAFSVEELAGQLVFAATDSTFLSSDSDAYDQLVREVHEAHIGGIVAFGGVEPAPQVMLNNTYGRVILGQPAELASITNRLQAIAKVPLLVTSDSEWGAGMRVAGATKFPRAMAFGAAGDTQLAYEAGRITAVESRAMGVQVNLGPVADLNNNPRNPVINIRSFGEDPSKAGAMVAAWVRGLQDGGMQATLKHFPGHGDTDVDSHLGLPIIDEPRARLDQTELPPFRSGITAGAAGVMVAHIELPEIDKDSGPATFSAPVIGGILRQDLGFDGVVYSDAMNMDAITKMATPGEAAVKAVKAGIDAVLDSPDSIEASKAIAAAIQSGEIPRAQAESAARRILRAKARAGLNRTRTVNIESVALHVGGRAHEAVAQQVADRAVTLAKDERNQVPLPQLRGSLLYLSVLDYPSGWRIAAPSRTAIPELKARWPSTDAVEISDRTSPDELDMVRLLADRSDAIVAGIFVRAASASGRLDLAPQVVKLLEDLARASAQTRKPFIAVFFGNPYAAMSVPSLPAMLFTYDFSDAAERAAVRAVMGEIPIGGKLPVALPGQFPLGGGIDRKK